MKTQINLKASKNFITIFFVLVSFSFLLYRITIHADIYDEMINLGSSYRTALGQLPFYDIWDSFQSGDILLAPFLWGFIKIIGRTGGIVLFSRIVYIFFLILVGMVIYFTVNKYLSKRNSFLLGYLFCFFQVYGLFYLWYDTSSIIMMTLGCLFMFRGINERKLNRVYFFMAGIFNGLMSFSYPSFILLAVFNGVLMIAFVFKSKKTMLKKSLFYMGGGLFIALIFAAYVFCIVGSKNFFTSLNIILSYRSVEGGSGAKILYSIISSFFNVNSVVIIPTIILVFIFHVALKKKMYSFVFIGGIILTGIVNQLTLDKAMLGLNNFMAYLALWAPCIYVLQKKKNETLYRSVLLFLWLPSILSSVCVALLTVYAKQGPIKCWQGFILAGVTTVWMIYDYLAYSNLTVAVVCSKLWIPFIICIMLFNSYNYIYLNQPKITVSDTRMKEGIYKGIKVEPGMENWIDIQNSVLEHTKGKHTILAGNRLRSIYLMTDLLPCTPSTEAPSYYKDGKWHWDMTLKYFKLHGKYPDIMFLEPYEIENKQIEKLLDKKYNLITKDDVGDFNILVYAKK